MSSVNLHVVLFDLDGTLIDSVSDIAAAVNKCLIDNGLAELAVDDVRGMVGNGMAKLVKRAFERHGIALDDVSVSQHYDAVLANYEADLHSRTVLLKGAVDAVDRFRAAGAAVAVVTNKPQQATERILEHFELTSRVALVVGGDLGLTRKPAPDMLLHALSHFGVSAERSLMVGDSQADLSAAAAAGVDCALVMGGYQGPEGKLDARLAKWTINDLTELSTGMLLRR